MAQDSAAGAGSVLQTYTPLLGDEATQTGNGQIANCIQDCDYLYTTGTDEGLTVYDIRDLDNPRFVSKIEMPHPKGGDAGGFTHDVYVGRSGSPG